MRVLNRHHRTLPASLDECGSLLESLSTRGDRLWPWEQWPPMKLASGKQEGSRGGHGPIRYEVESYEPGRRIVFRFREPRGFNGTHRFELGAEGKESILTHVIDMRLSGSALLSWPILFRPLHDALLEDGLDKAEADLSGTEWRRRSWSVWVRILRWFLARARRRKT